MRFEDLNLIPGLLDAVREQGYSIPTPIQEQAIPHVLAGQDLLGCAQTGTGKTAAFALPILQRLLHAERRSGRRSIRALVITPTRELASQIEESFRTYGVHTGLRATVIFGGVGQNPQVRALAQGVDILVATPGRLLDLMNQGFVKLNAVEVFVLDEGDRMLDMGFIHDIRKISAQLPHKRQTLLFSATLPPEISQLSRGMLDNPVSVSVTPSASTVETIDQSVYFVEKQDKIALLIHLVEQTAISRALVFTRTKHGADTVARRLVRASIQAAAIHGNKSQNNRERALNAFKKGSSPLLVATDIASRGLDIDDISHVINFDLPHEPECYVHRIGRTGRAGAAGAAISFCSLEERPILKAIERLTRKNLAAQTEHPFRSPHPVGTNPRSDQDGPKKTFGSHHPEAARSGNRRNHQKRRSWHGTGRRSNYHNHNVGSKSPSPHTQH
jgi:ATP-dependent RNA helicase RhlE